MIHRYYNQQQEIKHQEAVIQKLKSFNREKSIRRAESREKMLAKNRACRKAGGIRKITFSFPDSFSNQRK